MPPAPGLPVGLAEADPSGELEVARRVEAGAADGVLDEQEGHFVDMLPVGRGHPG